MVENHIKYKKWVVKIGSSLVTNNGLGLDLHSMRVWVQQIIELRAMGCQVVLVSSGAVAEGVSRLGLKSIRRIFRLTWWDGSLVGRCRS